MTKYNSSDKKLTLDKEDDAAYVNWGSYCRIPTNDEFTELRNPDNCTWTRVSMVTTLGSSSYGYKVTSTKNGNSIFFPTSGYCYMAFRGCYGSCCYYWSSTLNPKNVSKACGLKFGSEDNYLDEDSRYNGRPVRPVVEL